MRIFSLFALLFGLLQLPVFAGPEIFDPLEAWKKPNAPATRPVTETVVAGSIKEIARYRYENNLLSRIDYYTLGTNPVTPKEIPAGYTLFEYDKNGLVREQLFDGAGNMTEEIRYQYRAGRLEKSLIHDVRGNARIEWQYSYDKEGVLSGGRRLLAGKSTESFKILKTTGGWTQNIYNAKGELTSKVDSVLENGLLTHRIKSGLTGTKYADYRYNDRKLLIEIIFYDTVRGEKVLVKKHGFEYSLDRPVPGTAMK